MKTNGTSKTQGRIAALAACLAIGWICWSGEGVARAQTPPANLSPALLDVVKLAQNHLSDDIIIAQIKNSGTIYSLSADDILYLNSQGVSQNVIAALQQTRLAAPAMPSFPAPAPAQYPPPAAPVPPTAEAYVAPVAPTGSEINMSYFQGTLSPYGTWVDLPPYGLVWRPNDAAIPGWRPYFNNGYWKYTDAGWFWQSELPYGDIVFHYGRWLRDFRSGWVWIPGYDWAPAWVSWRHADGFAGWAPLPPAAEFEVGVGLMFHHGLAVGVDFGLGPDDYVFVDYNHFWDHDYRPFLLPREHLEREFRLSLVMNDHRFVDGRLVFDGLGRDRVAAFSHHAVVVDRIVIRDPRIEKARDVERARTIERVKQIQSRPANDPMRRNLENSQAIHRPAEAPRSPVDLRRGAPGARTPEPAGRGAPESKDTKDTKSTKDSKDSKDSK